MLRAFCSFCHRNFRQSFYNWSINASFSTAILVFTWFILEKKRSCLLLSDFLFSCCFYVFLNNFFVQYVWTLNRVKVKFLTSNQRTKHVWHNEFGWLPKRKAVYGQSSKILFKQKWGIAKASSFSPFLAGSNLPWKHTKYC